MGNSLCFPRDKTRQDSLQGAEDEYEAFQRAVYENEGEEKIERRGSMFPTSPSVAYRSSLGPSSIIPPYLEPSGHSPLNSGRSSIASTGSTGSRRGTRMFTNPAAAAGSDPKKSSREGKEVRILLLGSGESGKSTIIKQMKIIHQNGYNREELLAFRPAIFKNVEQGLQQVIVGLEVLKMDAILERCAKYLDYVRGLNTDYEENPVLPAELVEAVNYIWLESGVLPIFDQICHNAYIYESANYFFNNINRICQPEYLPTNEDVLRARIKTTGISETLFRTGLLTVRMIDIGGQRPERKKWVRTFEGVTTIIFCVSLSEYDQFLVEQPTQNRMLESFQLFKSIVTSRWFVNTSIVLFLNKKDIFQRKITKVPLSQYFDDYEGGPDYAAATDFIKQKFLSLNVNKLQIYPYLTEATDTNNINLVFAAVKETVLANSLKQSGLF